jgi:hypothetical protein
MAIIIKINTLFLNPNGDLPNFNIWEKDEMDITPDYGNFNTQHYSIDVFKRSLGAG